MVGIFVGGREGFICSKFLFDLDIFVDVKVNISWGAGVHNAIHAVSVAIQGVSVGVHAGSVGVEVVLGLIKVGFLEMSVFKEFVARDYLRKMKVGKNYTSF